MQSYFIQPNLELHQRKLTDKFKNVFTLIQKEIYEFLFKKIGMKIRICGILCCRFF